MIVICNGEVLTIWPHYLSVLTSFNFCCPLYPKMIHFDKWWKYSDLLCLNHLEMKTYKWCGPFPVLISYKIPNRRLRFQSSKFENGFYQWRHSAVHCCIRLIRIKIINCLYSQNPFSNFWLKTPNLLLPTLCIYWSIIS